jgi:hypothetical protein
MKNAFLVALAGLSLGTAIVAGADAVHDWKEVSDVHHHIVDAIREMEQAAAANHYDMKGHAKRAEQLLRDAEKELQLAIDSAKDAP